MYENTLIKAGLDEKQAKIYLACLELGKAKAPSIAKKAEIKRTTTYGILDELANLGLISIIIKGKSKLFKAEDPQAIVELLEGRKNEIVNILPQLRDVFTSFQTRPVIQFFEGREGIKRIYEDSLKCVSKKILQIVRVKDFIDFPGGDFSKEYIRKRVAKGIEAYALHPASGDVHNEMYGEQSEKLKRFVRYLPPNIFYASMIMIYDNKVSMASTKAENFGFIIESKEFSNTLRAYFEFMWRYGSKNPIEPTPLNSD